MTNQTSGRLIAGITGIFLLTSVSLAFSGSVTVSWDANTETDLEGYNVYYGLESKNYSDVLDVGNVNSVSLYTYDESMRFAIRDWRCAPVRLFINRIVLRRDASSLSN